MANYSCEKFFSTT